MTDQQIRDRIVGALSASMMPMEMEAECVAFLDRCVRNKTRADKIRRMDDEDLAKFLYEFLGDPFCHNFEECAALLDQDKEIPEGKCLSCVLQYIREVLDDGST